MRELRHVRLRKGAQHHRRKPVSPEHDGGILDAVSARQLRLLLGEEQVVAAQLAMPISKDTRVRVEALPNKSATVLPASMVLFSRTRNFFFIALAA